MTTDTRNVVIAGVALVALLIASFAITPGPKFSIATSESATRRRASSRASGLRRFRRTLPLPAQPAWFCRLRSGSAWPPAKGGSVRLMSMRARVSTL